MQQQRHVQEWLERKDTSVSSVYESVPGLPEALEIVEQYIIQPDEMICTRIDRLKGIQMLTQRGQPPTDALKLPKTQGSARNSIAYQLGLTIYYNHTFQPYVTVNMNYYREKYMKNIV